MADNLNIIKCPACQKEMIKVFIPEVGINLDVCLDGCGGIYFDNREFSNFDEAHENVSKILDVKKDKEFIKVDMDLPRVCPVCGAKMVKNHTTFPNSASEDVIVDDCYKCGGKFLDHGELIKIREQYSNNDERSAAIMNFIYDTVGEEIIQTGKRAEIAAKKRSITVKLFNKLIYG